MAHYRLASGVVHDKAFLFVQRLDLTLIEGQGQTDNF